MMLANFQRWRQTLVKTCTYRVGWEPEAANRRRVLVQHRGVLGVPSGLVGTNYTQSNSGFMETPCFKKVADFSCVMWICCGLAPCGPSALLATKNASFGKKDPHHGKNCGIFKIPLFEFFLPFNWSNSRYFGSKNGVLGCFGPSVR